MGRAVQWGAVTLWHLSTGFRSFVMHEYIALFFEAVRKSTDLADGLTQAFEESKGVLLSGRDANSP